MCLIEIIGRGLALSDLIEVITSAAIVTIVTIMTIALPLIITSMHKLVELYNTNYVMSIFNTDKSLKTFRFILVISVCIAIAWVVFFFLNCKCWLYWLSIALCGTTVALLSSLIVLVARIVYYTMPDKFIKLIFKKIRKSKAPNNYFDRSIYKFSIDSKEEKRRMKEVFKAYAYDEKSTFIFVVLARIYVSTLEDTVRLSIQNYWEDLCRKASHKESGVNYYANSYYNFIHEIERWATDHDDKKLQKDAILFTNILLKAHLPKPRRMGEPESDIDERRYLSAETTESLWKTIRRSVDFGSDEMFQQYWQIVNNMSSIKYESIVRYREPKNFIEEQKWMYKLHYSCCAYLIATEKYELLKYVLNYSQQHPFHWQLIPEKIEDIILVYLNTKKSYSDISYEMRFSFSEDYNLYDKKKTCFPLEQFTTLLLYYIWDIQKEKDANLHIENGYDRYIQTLIAVVDAYPEGMEWQNAIGMNNVDKKESIIQYLQNLLSHQVRPIKQLEDNKTQEEPKEKINVFLKWSLLFTTILFFIKSRWRFIVNMKHIKDRKIN